MTEPQLPRLADFDALVATARANVDRVAAERVTGVSAGDAVSAVATGAGSIVEIRVHPLAVRQLDNLTLGERVQEAVNAALDRAEALRPHPGPAPTADLDAQLEMFEHRMDGLLERLDRLTRDLDP